MTGLGDVSYTGAPDPNESTMKPTDDRGLAIYINSSDVTLDGLTITTNRPHQSWIGVWVNLNNSPLSNIKVTNCVIRHLFKSGRYDAIGLLL